TCLLHSNIAFRLLKKLTEVGDPLAEKVFKEEIVKRLNSGYAPVIYYLIEERYTDYLSREDFLFSILKPKEAEIILNLEKKLDTPFNIDNTEENLEWVQSSFSIDNKKVKRLQLVGLRLKYIPESVSGLKHLEYLFINGNLFEALPEWVENFKNLKKLDVSSCELESIPEVIGKLTTLVSLFLSNNHLEKFPNFLTNLIGLEELALDGNTISYLPESIVLICCTICSKYPQLFLNVFAEISNTICIILTPLYVYKLY
ncbi:hypothetical protein LCGC14_3119990, partial [marine sediment metagenome]